MKVSATVVAPRTFEHIVVLAGASCCGKSTLAARLMDGSLPELARSLGIDPAATYHQLYGRDWEEISEASADRVLLQYDITHSNPFADAGDIRPGALAILAAARALSVVVVWERPEELGRRLQQRYKARGGLWYTLLQVLRKRGLSRARQSLDRFNQRKQLFEQPDALWQNYRKWLASLERLPDARVWMLQSVAPEKAIQVERPPAAPPWR